MGLEKCLDGRGSGIQLQFHNSLQGGNLLARVTREHPSLRWGAVREEGKASKTNRRPPLGGICEDENRWGEYLLLREKHPNTQLVCGERLQARQTVEGGRFSRLGKRSLWTTGCERRNEPLEAVQQRYLGPHRAGEESKRNLTDYAEELPHSCRLLRWRHASSTSRRGRPSLSCGTRTVIVACLSTAAEV